MKFRNRFLKYVIHANEAAAVDDGGAAAGDTGDGATDDDLGGAGGEPAQGYWPDDWASKMTNGDEKLSKIAGRYASPEAMFNALVAAQNRIRSGELKPALPDNPSDEEMAQWREDNGIPKSANDYDLTFDSGLVLNDEDKETYQGFLDAAHNANFTNEQVKAAIEWDNIRQEEEINARHELDADQRTAALDELNVEWGGNFRRNVNMVQGLLNMLPEDVRDEFRAARLPDGTALFNNANILRGFAAIAGELNPAGVVVPAEGGDPMKGVNDEIAEIESFMNKDRKAYNKDEKMQARYRELLGAREKLNARG